MKYLLAITTVLLVCLFLLIVITKQTLSTSIKLQAQIRDTQWEQDSINHQTKNGLRDYQLDVTKDSIYLYDNNRLVGTFYLDYDNDPISTMILEDNQ